MIKELDFPGGIKLLKLWQTNDNVGVFRLKQILNETIKGQYDSLFSSPAPSNRVHVCGPVDLLTLTIMYQLFGIVTEQFYKQDAKGFVRTSLMIQKLLGMSKHYISWPVYGFTAEAMGQPMLYSDQYSPGTDPDKPLFNRDNWQSMKTPDLDRGIPKLLDDVMDRFHHLTGQQPVMHLSAAYSLAADCFGQEAIISALSSEPEFVVKLLDQLTDVVLAPWTNHFFNRYPAGWLELSDASGSPFFIGPDNCKNIAIRAIRRLIHGKSWGDRVYIANYRGDYVTQANKEHSGRRRRRPGKANNATRISLTDLSIAKTSVCRDFVIRLAEDRIPIAFYEERALTENIPLFLGIGATQIDRNSITNLSVAKTETAGYCKEYVETIKRVANQIADNGYVNRESPWPGNIYFEDISAESDFDLLEIIIGSVLKYGHLNS